LTSMPPALRAAVFRRCFHMAPLEPKTKDILDGIFEGNRTMLARGITLGMDSLSLTSRRRLLRCTDQGSCSPVESTRLDHRAQAQSLIYHAATSMMARSQHRAQTTFRIGLSGPPGVSRCCAHAACRPGVVSQRLQAWLYNACTVPLRGWQVDIHRDVRAAPDGAGT
jgi:hypothetical protein